MSAASPVSPQAVVPVFSPSRPCGRLILATLVLLAALVGITAIGQQHHTPGTPVVTSPSVTSPTAALPSAVTPSVPPPVSAVTPAPTTPVLVPPVATRHTVIRGDTLWDISTTFTGDGLGYHVLAAVNHIANPDLIYPGQTLDIPWSPAAAP